MRYFEMHAHMVSRTTDDYERMALAGCVGVLEPAFWAGFDRSSIGGFRDYFSHLTDFEVKRSGNYGIVHYTMLAMNPKEAENRNMSKEVLRLIPGFLSHKTVLGIGEIGFNKNSKNELETFKEHVQLAIQNDQLILVHTPHLEDKYKGTILTIDALNELGAEPNKVIIDHVEEHTIKKALDNGYWASITLYPSTKCTPERAADMVECHGADKILIGSACDWGESDPLAIPKFIHEMKMRGHPHESIKKIVHQNPMEFLSQCPKFEIP